MFRIRLQKYRTGWHNEIYLTGLEFFIHKKVRTRVVIYAQRVFEF